ncbi:unnamed protein product [Didymodactylos carnosus]|uniref:Uncharacterized protein n=1 Tax=Didymodactylos carnosus TaxID=1234261 RepID=A0A815I821_9BILA|nr:unnamed protein product [Didymodactylos carnosus]CAF1361529.1 unnamed protein product [Didymodactylos carnosus]CAF3945332.1 unnamed protein product [Didymodactylos carnosus]CAF4240312.1 unnamed protein product [Didymodactylos carnosus]
MDTRKFDGIGEYVNLREGTPCHLHPTSTLFGCGFTPHYIVYHELVMTRKVLNILKPTDHSIKSCDERRHKEDNKKSTMEEEMRIAEEEFKRIKEDAHTAIPTPTVRRVVFIGSARTSKFPLRNYYYMNQQMYGQQPYVQQQRQQATMQRTTNMTSATTRSYPSPVSPPLVPSLTEHQQPSVSTYQHVLPTQFAVTIGVDTSTPHANKRARGDVSGNSDQDLQRQMNQQFRTRVINKSAQNQASSAYKCQRPNAQQTNANRPPPRHTNAQQRLILV